MPAISLLTGACVPAYAKFPEQGDYWCNASRIVHNATIADNVLQVILPVPSLFTAGTRAKSSELGPSFDTPDANQRINWQHGGKIWPEATGILMQVAHDSELTHNDIHAYYCTIAALSRCVPLSPSR